MNEKKYQIINLKNFETQSSASLSYTTRILLKRKEDQFPGKNFNY